MTRELAQSDRKIRARVASPTILIAGLGLVCVLSAIYAACAPSLPSSTKKIVKDCELPTDQQGSILSKWSTLPVPIAFQANAFSSDEMAAITAAADTWNSFYKDSLGIAQVLDYGDASSPRTSQNSVPSSPCSQGILLNGQFSGPVVIFKDSKWPSQFSHAAMAITTNCSIASTPYRKAYMAIMEINFEDFFVQGKIVPDMQSIIGHELGHLLGLKHSCQLGGETGMPMCDEANLPTAYIEALMFPSFSSDAQGNGEQKRDLRDNDEGRANCIYQDQKTTN